MRKIFLLVIATGIITACQSSQNQTNGQPGEHKITVQEVLQTTNYTYLHVKENDSVIWLAVPLMNASPGETYYYENPMRMPAFQSKELNRTFDAVYFLAGVSKEPVTGKQPAQTGSSAPASNDQAYTTPEGPKRSLADPHSPPATQVVQKKDVKIDPAKDGITIKQLYTKKDSYQGKTIRVRGEVTKLNPGIMNRNWIHIQDGTAAGDKFDLTVTTEMDAKIGDIITFEGKISLNKDFGYGYFYDVIMEEAVQK